MSSYRARSRSPPVRPTTPLRPSSRASLRSSTNQSTFKTGEMPLDVLESQFAELSDSFADLESNMLHLQLMHESLSRFSENFAAFLYGLEMNAFVVDWPEQPLVESIQRWKAKQKGEGDTTILAKTPTKSTNVANNEVDSTLLSDTTFASMRATPARRRTFVPEEKKSSVANRGRGMGSGMVDTKKSGIPGRNNSNAGSVTRGASGNRGTGVAHRGRGRAMT